MFLAFRVGDQERVRMLHHEPGDLFGAEDLVHHAGTVPQDHVATGLLDEVAAQIDVRRKNDGLILRDAFYDVYRVGGRAANIRQGLQFCRAINIADHQVIGVFFLEFPEQVRRTAIGQRATRFEVGQQYFLLG